MVITLFTDPGSKICVTARLLPVLPTESRLGVGLDVGQRQDLAGAGSITRPMPALGADRPHLVGQDALGGVLQAAVDREHDVVARLGGIDQVAPTGDGPALEVALDHVLARVAGELRRRNGSSSPATPYVVEVDAAEQRAGHVARGLQSLPTRRR